MYCMSAFRTYIYSTYVNKSQIYTVASAPAVKARFLREDSDYFWHSVKSLAAAKTVDLCSMLNKNQCENSFLMRLFCAET